jgi:hypothetical protein
MVHTRATEDATLDILERSASRGHGRGQVPHNNAPPPSPPRPPLSIEQLPATQDKVMIVLMQNEARRGLGRPQNLRQ